MISKIQLLALQFANKIKIRQIQSDLRKAVQRYPSLRLYLKNLS